MVICRTLSTQSIWSARNLAAAKTGSKIAARMAMIAMTTNNSIKVNAPPFRRLFVGPVLLMLIIPIFLKYPAGSH